MSWKIPPSPFLRLKSSACPWSFPLLHPHLSGMVCHHRLPALPPSWPLPRASRVDGRSGTLPGLPGYTLALGPPVLSRLVTLGKPIRARPSSAQSPEWLPTSVPVRLVSTMAREATGTWLLCSHPSPLALWPPPLASAPAHPSPAHPCLDTRGNSHPRALLLLLPRLLCP